MCGLCRYFVQLSLPESAEHVVCALEAHHVAADGITSVSILPS